MDRSVQIFDPDNIKDLEAADLMGPERSGQRKVSGSHILGREARL